MNDLSLKGVARRYGGITGGFSVVADIFKVSGITGSVSLRSKLESMAREEHSFSMAECIFGWTAAFEQTWTHIRIRIRLNPDANVSAATVNTCRIRWKNGILTIWNNKWGCGHSGELTCRLSFEVMWVNTGQHHDVRVSTGIGQTVMDHWHTSDWGNVAAHEYGHMLWLWDEYRDQRCPGRNSACTLSAPLCTGTVMDNNSNNVPSRMMTRFANNIGSNVV